MVKDTKVFPEAENEGVHLSVLKVTAQAIGLGRKAPTYTKVEEVKLPLFLAAVASDTEDSKLIHKKHSQVNPAGYKTCPQT